MIFLNYFESESTWQTQLGDNLVCCFIPGGSDGSPSGASTALTCIASHECLHGGVGDVLKLLQIGIGIPLVLEALVSSNIVQLSSMLMVVYGYIVVNAWHIYNFCSSMASTLISVFTARIHMNTALHTNGEANREYPMYLINGDWEKDVATNNPTTCKHLLSIGDGHKWKQPQTHQQ